MKKVVKMLKFVEVLYGVANASLFVFLIGNIFFNSSAIDNLSIGNIQIGDGKLTLHMPWYISALWFLTALAGYVLLVHLNRFFKNISEHNIFIEKNVTHLNWIGYSLAVFLLINDLKTYLIAQLALPYLKTMHVAVDIAYNISWTYFFGIIPFFVLGYIFKQANKAVEENNNTI